MSIVFCRHITKFTINCVGKDVGCISFIVLLFCSSERAGLGAGSGSTHPDKNNQCYQKCSASYCSHHNNDDITLPIWFLCGWLNTCKGNIVRHQTLISSPLITALYISLTITGWITTVPSYTCTFSHIGFSTKDVAFITHICCNRSRI